MTDGKSPPSLQPPPRIHATTPEPAPGRGPGARGASRRQTVTRLALTAVMLLGLVAVFVLLPRWQERSPEAPPDRAEVEEVAPQPVPPITGVVEPTKSVDYPKTPPHRPPPSTPLPSAPLRPSTPPAHPPAEDSSYIAAVSEGLVALNHRQWASARSAFERAARLQPGTPEVADGLTRVAAGERLQTIAEDLRRAREFERGEAWREAAKAYSSVLAIDPQSAEGLEGQRRCDTRVALDDRLEFHLANPNRLTNPSVQEDATEVLDEARRTTPGGPRIASQIARLGALLELAKTPVTVVLESDTMTEVTVYRVGRLGTFARRELHLSPGAYTVIGTRDGFRDVRLKLVVDPGAPPSPLLVRCTERL